MRTNRSMMRENGSTERQRGCVDVEEGFADYNSTPRENSIGKGVLRGYTPCGYSSLLMFIWRDVQGVMEQLVGKSVLLHRLGSHMQLQANKASQFKQNATHYQSSR